jgi:hypothetical protein
MHPRKKHRLAAKSKECTGSEFENHETADNYCTWHRLTDSGCNELHANRVVHSALAWYQAIFRTIGGGQNRNIRHSGSGTASAKVPS